MRNASECTRKVPLGIPKDADAWLGFHGGHARTDLAAVYPTRRPAQADESGRQQPEFNLTQGKPDATASGKCDGARLRHFGDTDHLVIDTKDQNTTQWRVPATRSSVFAHDLDCNDTTSAGTYMLGEHVLKTPLNLARPLNI